MSGRHRSDLAGSIARVFPDSSRARIREIGLADGGPAFFREGGPAGPKGDKGDPGTLGPLEFVQESFSIEPNSEKYFTRNCPAGYEVTGGGYQPHSDQMTIDESKPSRPNGWNVHVALGNAVGARGVTVFAICAKVG